MIAIEHHGQRMWVHSLDGHDGCTVIAKNVPEPPPSPCTLCPVTGQALPNAAATEDQRINEMSNVELVKHILGLLKR